MKSVKIRFAGIAVMMIGLGALSAGCNQHSNNAYETTTNAAENAQTATTNAAANAWEATKEGAQAAGSAITNAARQTGNAITNAWENMTSTNR